MEALATPRINFTLLPKCKGRTVLLVGKVLAVNQASGQAMLETSDQGQVTVQLNSNSPIQGATGLIVEVTGQVQQDMSIQEAESALMGDDWDPMAYDKMVNASLGFDQLLGWWS
ncbi:replication factor A protein 3 [Powellomyces hirtus]|nr:replication factor A protein 3 [Powellomyces hirtus]